MVTLTLDSSGIEINQTSLQDALDLKAGSKGLKIEVEVGTLPSTAETIDFVESLLMVQIQLYRLEKDL